MKKTALVTGGTSGIGLATALSLHNDHGYDVWVLSRRDFQMDGLRHVRCDVSKENEVTKAVEQIMLEAGRLDLVVNCAGMGISGALEFTDEEDARYLFNVNFFGTVNINKACVDLPTRRGPVISFMRGLCSSMSISILLLRVRYGRDSNSSRSFRWF